MENDRLKGKCQVLETQINKFENQIHEISFDKENQEILSKKELQSRSNSKFEKNNMNVTKSTLCKNKQNLTPFPNEVTNLFESNKQIAEFKMRDNLTL